MSHLNVTVRKHVMKVCTVPLTTDDGTTMTELREGAIRESGRESSLRGGR